jgi:hypothetical protein
MQKLARSPIAYISARIACEPLVRRMMPVYMAAFRMWMR